MANTKADNPEQQEMFDYLDALRESGTVNMFGASPHLVRDFGIRKGEAMEVLSAWMKAFGQ